MARAACQGGRSAPATAGERIALVEIERAVYGNFGSAAPAARVYAKLRPVLRRSASNNDGVISPAPRVLEGGVRGAAVQLRFYVTSNRRHIVPREMRENELADAINARDVLDDRLALADRFGLSLGFHACDQATYLAMVAAYADAYGLDFDATEAVAWATGRGARSGRVAWQYVQDSRRARKRFSALGIP